MHITHLSLTNFRNYGRLELTLPQGPILLYGNNAQGKTNLLEAIYYLATTRSPHADNDAQLLNWDAAQAEEPVIVGRINATVATTKQAISLEMRLIQEQKATRSRTRNFSFRRQALLDRRKVRLMDLLGAMRVVLFLPEDVQLLTGSPANRRRYMDITLCQIDPVYCRTLSNYNKVLEQRNATLRQLAEGQPVRDVLPIYTEKLVDLGSSIFLRRAKFIANISQQTQRIHYESLTAGKESIKLLYMPRLNTSRSKLAPGDLQNQTELTDWLESHQGQSELVSERFSKLLEESLATDIARGATTIGPHRDDWSFQLNGRSLGSFGSRGQQRTAILALKMGEINWMESATGERPILLLDEVVAELDENRRAALLNTVTSTTQAILTATDPGMFSESFLQQATRMEVENGRIKVM
ncbi:DNA replication/repair protein RecF [Candidatus Leptofilum sp.]|uniref:DNA replication/repair protein RecF n=1 Tax=Candidatus Leptofilum sp. TaxID=3241576 RepID=UPI003B5CDBEF